MSISNRDERAARRALHRFVKTEADEPEPEPPAGKKQATYTIKKGFTYR